MKGGARPGAGRKPKGRKKVGITLPKHVIKWLDDNTTNKSQAIEIALINQYGIRKEIDKKCP